MMMMMMKSIQYSIFFSPLNLLVEKQHKENVMKYDAMQYNPKQRGAWDKYDRTGCFSCKSALRRQNQGQ